MKFNLKNLKNIDFSKKTTIVVVSIVTVFTLIFLNFLLRKSEVKPMEEKQEETYKKPNYEEENKDKEGFKEMVEQNGGKKDLYLIPFKQIIDKKNDKFMVIFVYSDSDLSENADFTYKMIYKGKEIELKREISEELFFTLEGKIPDENEFIIEAVNVKDKNDIRKFKFDKSKAVELDLSNSTEESFEKYEELRRSVMLSEARVSAAKDEISEQNSRIKYIDKKIEEYKKKDGDDYKDLVKTLEKSRAEASSKLDAAEKQKADGEAEAAKSKSEISKYESDYTKIFDTLHTAHTH
jgi:hypothetical protein